MTMRGRIVALARPTDDDYRLMERWLGPEASSPPLTGDLGADHTAEELKQADRGDGPTFYVIKLLTDGTPVGVVNHRRESPRVYSIGGAVGDSALWQTGYAADAFIVLIDYLFHLRNARKVQSMVMTFNKSSLRMMSRAGFVCEGILREHCYLDGQWHDAALWSMLRAEFYARVERDAAVSERFALRDLVPEADKAEARRVLAEHLRAGNGGTSIDLFVDQALVPAG